jgi:hypothetical protein
MPSSGQLSLFGLFLVSLETNKLVETGLNKSLCGDLTACLVIVHAVKVSQTERYTQR